MHNKCRLVAEEVKLFHFSQIEAVVTFNQTKLHNPKLVHSDTINGNDDQKNSTVWLEQSVPISNVLYLDCNRKFEPSGSLTYIGLFLYLDFFLFLIIFDHRKVMTDSKLCTVAIP